MANRKNNVASVETRRRLIDAAGEIFAERGFAQATIRDITQRASTSIASVNYHFREKTELYNAVMELLESDMRGVMPPESVLTGGPAEQLRAFVRHFLSEILQCDEQPEWMQVLWARELASPSPAMKSLIDKVIRPVNDRLTAILRQLAPASLSREQELLQTSSIMGQMLYFVCHQPVVAHLYPDVPHVGAPQSADLIADHIVRFSLAALACKDPPARVTQPRKSPSSRRGAAKSGER